MLHIFINHMSDMNKSLFDKDRGCEVKLKLWNRGDKIIVRCMKYPFVFVSKGIHIWWRHQMENFPRYWPFVWEIPRSPVNSPHKGQWRRALMFSLICVWINGWVNNREAGDLRRYRTHYDVTVMIFAMQIVYDTEFTGAHLHRYHDVIMGVSIVCSAVCLGTGHRMYQAPLRPLRGEFTGDRWIPLTKGQ